MLPRALRIMLALSLLIAIAALIYAFVRTARSALGTLGLVLRDLGSGRLEVRAPDHLPGISGDLAHDINRLAQQYAELRSGVDARIAQPTARLKRDSDHFAPHTQDRRGTPARATT